MRRLAAFAVVTIFAISIAAGAVTRPEAAYSPETDLQPMVFFAVLEGLYVDGVSNEAVDVLLRREDRGNGAEQYMHFIYGCPICLPAQDALRVYRQRVPLSYKGSPDTLGEGLPDWSEPLTSIRKFRDDLFALRGESPKEPLNGVGDVVHAGTNTVTEPEPTGPAETEPEDCIPDKPDAHGYVETPKDPRAYPRTSLSKRSVQPR